jgi:hypothetical protein
MAPLKIGKQATSAYDRLAQGMEELADQAKSKKSSSSKPAKAQDGGSFVVSGTVDGEGIEDTFGSKGEALKYIQSLLKSASDYDVELSSGDKVLESYSSSPGEEETAAGEESFHSSDQTPGSAPTEEEEGIAGDRSLIREKEKLGLMSDEIPRYGEEEVPNSEQEKPNETSSEQENPEETSPKRKKVVAKVVRRKKR